LTTQEQAAKKYPGDPKEEGLVKYHLDRGGHKSTLLDLSNALDRSPDTIREILRVLQKKAYNFTLLPNGNISWDSEPVAGNVIKHSMGSYSGGWRLFGACGDQHLGSIHAREDVTEALYDLYLREGATQVFNTGNWIDGEAGRLNFADLKVFGLDDQISYAVKHYPCRKGVTTYFIAGDDHEGWYQQRNRIVIGAHFERMAREAGRSDLVYIGYMEADIEMPGKSGSAFLKVMHPGGGSAYAESYACQKIAEAFQEGEKPSVCLVGHYHKMGYGLHRGIHFVQTGTGEDQSNFMRKQKIKAAVGGVLIQLNQAADGTINRFRPEFFTFFDRGFYTHNHRNFDTAGRVNPAGLKINEL
jgi:hypothetical protein